MRSGKLRAPYIALLTLLLMQQASFQVMPRIAWWNDLSAWIVSL